MVPVAPDARVQDAEVRQLSFPYDGESNELCLHSLLARHRLRLLLNVSTLVEFHAPLALIHELQNAHVHHVLHDAQDARPRLTLVQDELALHAIHQSVASVHELFLHFLHWRLLQYASQAVQAHVAMHCDALRALIAFLHQDDAHALHFEALALREEALHATLPKTAAVLGIEFRYQPPLPYQTDPVHG